MESRGNLEYSKDGMDIGVNQFGSTLQFGGGYPLNGYEKVKSSKAAKQAYKSQLIHFNANILIFF